MQGADGCCAGKQADGEQRVRSADTSKLPPVMPTACAHKGMRASVCVSGCCAGSEQMVHGGSASCQQKVHRDYIWTARAIAHFGKRAIHQVKRICGP